MRPPIYEMTHAIDDWIIVMVILLIYLEWWWPYLYVQTV